VSEPTGDGATEPTGDGDSPVHLTALVSGHVQGVGFRWWTKCRALELGLLGQAANLPDGRVRISAEGTRQSCERLVALLRGGTAPGVVELVQASYTPAAGGLCGFVER